MSYRLPLKLRLSQFNSTIGSPLICDTSLYLISKQMIKSLLRHNFLRLSNSQRSYLKNISNLIKLSLSLVLYYLPSICQSLYTLYIQFSISPYQNLLLLILFLKELIQSHTSNNQHIRIMNIKLNYFLFSFLFLYYFLELKSCYKLLYSVIQSHILVTVT